MNELLRYALARSYSPRMAGKRGTLMHTGTIRQVYCRKQQHRARSSGDRQYNRTRHARAMGQGDVATVGRRVVGRMVGRARAGQASEETTKVSLCPRWGCSCSLQLERQAGEAATNC